jgi:hypothetical protein
MLRMGRRDEMKITSQEQLLLRDKQRERVVGMMAEALEAAWSGTHDTADDGQKVLARLLILEALAEYNRPELGWVKALED